MEKKFVALRLEFVASGEPSQQQEQMGRWFTLVLYDLARGDSPLSRGSKNSLDFGRREVIVS
jgi:hypothetical protein